MEGKEFLTECEERVMEVLWESDEELSIQQIMEALNANQQRKWVIQTVSTFLARARRKGCVGMRRSGRQFYYTPLVSKNEYVKERLQQINDIFNMSNEDIKKLL